MRAKLCSTPCSSFKHGMITVIACPLYIRPFHQHSLTSLVRTGMMGVMKWLSNMAVAAFAGLLISAAHAQVLGVKTVYVLPMAGGLDQYLALQLTSEGVLQVVTDPQKADAILTDGIGARLEENLTELFGAPVTNDKPEKDKPEKDQSGKAGTDDFAHPAMQPLSHSRGVVFLVNRTSRNVLWSTYERPKNTQPGELKRA